MGHEESKKSFEHHDVERQVPLFNGFSFIGESEEEKEVKR